MQCTFLTNNAIKILTESYFYTDRHMEQLGCDNSSALTNIPYSLKIWWGIKFGVLAVCIYNCQIKNPSILLTCIYRYGDPVPNGQI